MLPNPPLTVLAVDPGFDRVGAAVLQKINSGEILLHSTCIRTDRKDSPAERIQTITKSLEKIIEKFKPEHFITETILFAKNKKTAINVAQARGAMINTASNFGLSVFEYSPLQVQIAITSYGRGDKKQISYMVSKLLKLDTSNMIDDECDAIAVGLTHLSSYNPVFHSKNK